MKSKGTQSDQDTTGVRHRETTQDDRQRVITLRNYSGMTWAKIAKTLGINQQTCQRIYERTKATGTPSNTLRTGRPPIFDEAEKQHLVAFITQDSTTRRLSWIAIGIEMGYACSPKTIQNVMHSIGYHKRVPRHKPHIRPYNKPKHVTWCQEHLYWTYDEWKRIIWTDESSFSTAGFGHRPWVIRRPDEEYHPDCIDETFEQGRKTIMAWGVFCSTIKSELIFIPGKAKMDSALYIEHIMEPHLISFWHQCYKEYEWTKVAEDGALGHKKHAIEYRNLNNIDSVPWPAQSPDLNLIESFWMDIETELGEI